MKLQVFDHKGSQKDAWTINEKVLGQVNPALLAQALRVYEVNSHQGTSRVKTRGEVVGSTKKIYRQKGTGNARHGARYAPLFVGGGIAHGPKGVRALNLVLPKKMRARALSSSLLLKLQESHISGLADVTKLPSKASQLAELLSLVAGHPHNKVLVVLDSKADNLFRGLKNIQEVDLKMADIVNAYDLIYYDHLLVTREAFDKLMSRATMQKAPTPVKKAAEKLAVTPTIKSTKGAARVAVKKV